MTSLESKEERVPRGWRSVLAAMISLGIMLVLCIAAVKTLAWFSDPTSGSRSETEQAWDPMSTDFSKNTFPPGVEEGLGNAESLVIYLVGVRPRPADAPEAESPPKEIATFHGWPIFGTAHVTSTQEVRSIIRSVIQGVERYRSEPIGCFFPRHGVRAASKDGWIIDLVICYQCQNMEVYLTPSTHEKLLAGEADEQPARVYTFDDSRQPLNEALQAAGVDLKQEVIAGLPKP
jgi:hypothetical protein